jgi:hypothetical protein
VPYVLYSGSLVFRQIDSGNNFNVAIEKLRTGCSITRTWDYENAYKTKMLHDFIIVDNMEYIFSDFQILIKIQMFVVIL